MRTFKRTQALAMLKDVATNLDEIARREEVALEKLEENGCGLGVYTQNDPQEQRTMAENVRLAIEILE